MIELTVKRSEIGKYTYFRVDEKSGEVIPNCLVGHVLHHLGVKPVNYEDGAVNGWGVRFDAIPEELKFLTKPFNDANDIGQSEVWKTIAFGSDQGKHDEAVSEFAKYGVIITLV